MPRPTSEEMPTREELPPAFMGQLRRILPASNRIFSGTVLHVQHHNSPSSNALATTAIQFRVDEAIRGVSNNQIIQIKEWGALWQSGEQYHPGQRVLLFLYPPSKLGLTSPVGGGRFAVNGSGGVLGGLGMGGGVSVRPRKPVAIQRVITAIRAAERE